MRACVRACVCVTTPKVFNNMWCDTDPYDWLNNFNNLYVAAIVDTIVGVALELF